MPVNISEAHATNRTSAICAASIGIMAIAACGAGGAGDIAGVLGVGQLSSIRISGDSVVAVGDTIRLSARGTRAGVLGMFVYDRVLDASWSVSDPNVATIVTVLPPASDSTSGSAVIVTGRRQGIVQVVASARGVQASRSVRVVSSP